MYYMLSHPPPIRFAAVVSTAVPSTAVPFAAVVSYTQPPILDAQEIIASNALNFMHKAKCLPHVMCPFARFSLLLPYL